MAKIWEQQRDETGLRYEQFKVYLLMPRQDRSYLGAWRKWNELNNTPLPPSGEPGGTFFAMVNENRWEERALAYDRHEDKKLMDQLQQRRLKSLLEVADLGETLRKKAATAARMLSPISQTIGTQDGRDVLIMAVTLTPDQIVRMADIGTKIEQLALGNPTENMAVVEAPSTATTENARTMLDKKLEEIRQRQKEARESAEAAAAAEAEPGRVVGTIGA
jgi:translation initiation factor 2B subunit (eIF-2B alpha/beta/delta family)